MKESHTVALIVAYYLSTGNPGSALDTGRFKAGGPLSDGSGVRCTFLGEI